MLFVHNCSRVSLMFNRMRRHTFFCVVFSSGLYCIVTEVRKTFNRDDVSYFESLSLIIPLVSGV